MLFLKEHQVEIEIESHCSNRIWGYGCVREDRLDDEIYEPLSFVCYQERPFFRDAFYPAERGAIVRTRDYFFPTTVKSFFSAVLVWESNSNKTSSRGRHCELLLIEVNAWAIVSLLKLTPEIFGRRKSDVHQNFTCVSSFFSTCSMPH
jgi:hypothetical protein